MSATGAVVAGGGLAAQRCVERLRRFGYDAPIRMVCAEPVPPYDRPPLSKDYLAGTMTDPPRLRPTEWYADNEVELLLGRRAARLLPHESEVELDDGERLRYDRLLIATGASARALAGSERYQNAHVLRSRRSSDAKWGGGSATSTAPMASTCAPARQLSGSSAMDGSSASSSRTARLSTATRL